MKRKLIKTISTLAAVMMSVSICSADTCKILHTDIRQDLIFSKNNYAAESEPPKENTTISSFKPKSSKERKQLLEMECIPMSVSPGYSLLPNGDIDVSFKFKNISNKEWNLDDIEIVLVEGSEYLKYEGREIFVPKTGAKYGESVNATFDVIAPGESGNYLFTAELYKDGEFLCEASNVLCVWGND